MIALGQAVLRDVSAGQAGDTGQRQQSRVAGENGGGARHGEEAAMFRDGSHQAVGRAGE